MDRRLAAILVADVVGYSRLMEADEAGTLAALKERRKAILEPAVRGHAGRIVKLMGDGVLVEFASAVNAVKAALELQGKFADANATLLEDRRIVLRIGINVGDVIGEGADIYGDGVNIAARLEGLAEPGGICISGTVHEHVQRHVALTVTNLGEQALKNIERPVSVYRIHAPSPASVEPAAIESAKLSIAVLPFANMSGDPEQQYFSDGITEDIITELSRFRSLFVIARNSSFQYRDKGVDVRRVARELGVRYMVEGSVRKLGNRVRITAQLIDATPGAHLWSERYDRGLEELFDVQDEVTRTIVASLTSRLEDAEIRSASAKRTGSMAAYDCLLRGIGHLRGHAPDDNRIARELFERALALDPTFALARAYFALALLVEHNYASAPEAIKKRALAEASAAVTLDPLESRCHIFLGQAYRFLGNYDQAVSSMEGGLALNPNDANALVHLAGVLGIVGRAEEGIALVRKAMRLDPHHPSYYGGALSSCLYRLRRYEEALAANRQLAGERALWRIARDAACLAQLGRMDEARAVSAEVLRRKPDFSVAAEMPDFKYARDAEHLREGLLKAGLPE